jgi:hypothetical protein
MVGKAKECWRELCDLAAVVDDPKMLAEEKRLNGENLPSGANS